MSESQLIFPDFRDEQEDSKYPFSDRSTFTAIDSAVVLSKKMLVDASIYVIGGRGAAYISQIAATNNAVTIVVKTTDNTTAIATTTIEASRLYTDENVTAELRDNFSRPAGVLVIRTANFNHILARSGIYEFGPTGLEFVASCFTPAQEAGLRGVLINDTEFVTGNILLVGYAGVALRKLVTNTQQYNHCADANIRIDIVGNPLFKRLRCAKEGTSPKSVNYIRTINNSPPDEFGHFVFTPIEDAFSNEADPTNPVAIRVYPVNENSIVIEAVRKRDV